MLHLGGAVASRPERVRGLGELDLQHQVQLRWQYFARLKQTDEGRGISTSLKFPSRMAGRVAQVRGVEALVGPAVVPFLRGFSRL